MSRYHKIKNTLASWSGKKWQATNWKNVELISIHIPKTAGTSFFHTLKKQYGEKKVVRIDHHPKGKPTEKIRINKIEKSKAYIYQNPKVIHGHFNMAQLQEHIDLAHDVPIITWLRDPAERVISNYFYLSKRLEEELDERKKKLDILAKMKRSLLEYAQNERNQNRISKFLNGVALEDFFFIGLVENYNEDVQELGKKLNWTAIEVVEHNRTGKKNKSQVEESVKEIIRFYNQADYELYNQALELRHLKT